MPDTRAELRPVAYWCWMLQQIRCVGCWSEESGGTPGQAMFREDVTAGERCQRCDKVLRDG